MSEQFFDKRTRREFKEKEVIGPPDFLFSDVGSVTLPSLVPQLYRKQTPSFTMHLYR